jgi:hypothetical protein
MWRAGDEKLPSAWPREFVDEMVSGGYAAKPNSAAAKEIATEREAAAPAAPAEQATAVDMKRPRRTS